MSSSSSSDQLKDEINLDDEFKFKFVPIQNTQSEPFLKVFTGYYPDGLVKSVPGGFVTIPRVALNADKFPRIEPRKDDIWLLTFPKTGTTWVSEMLWLIQNDCDFEKARQIPLFERTFFPEAVYLLVASELNSNPAASSESGPATEINQAPSPRIVRPHLPFYLLHPKILDTSKVVYVTRNPKDVIVSFYFHHKLMKGQGLSDETTVDEFAEYFMNNEVVYAPFFPHVLDAWSKRDHPNMHFIFYEDLKRDLVGEIKKMAAFLGKELSEAQIDLLKEHSKFENIQKNDKVNMEIFRTLCFREEGQFVRKGKVGDWKNHFSPEMNEKIDLWVEKNLAGTDLKFVSELPEQD